MDRRDIRNVVLVEAVLKTLDVLRRAKKIVFVLIVTITFFSRQYKTFYSVSFKMYNILFVQIAYIQIECKAYRVAVLNSASQSDV